MYFWAIAALLSFSILQQAGEMTIVVIDIHVYRSMVCVQDFLITIQTCHIVTDIDL